MNDWGPQDSKAFDFQLDDVTCFQPRCSVRTTEVQHAASSHDATGYHVTGVEFRIPRGVFDQLRPSEEHVGGIGAGEFVAVDEGAHREVQAIIRVDAIAQ